MADDTEDAFVGNIFFERGDGNSPESYTRLCSIFSISELGQENDLIDATTFCSAGSKEYISGLADGTELTIEANYMPNDAGITSMIADVKAKAKRDFRIVVEEGSPDTNFLFNARCRSWKLKPSVDNKNTISFTFKINGDITIA